MPVKYSELSSRQQIRLIRQKALLAAKQFGLRVDELRCVNHGYNTTFRLKSGAKTYAMRLGVNTKRSVKNIHAEHEWMGILLKAGAKVPKLKTLKGSTQTLLLLPKDEIFQAIPVTVMEWVPGSILGNRRASSIIRQLESLGRQTALLHESSQNLKFSKKAEFEKLSGVLWNRPNNIKDFRRKLPKLVSEKRQKFFSSLLKQVKKIDKALCKKQNAIPIHADLHVWNISSHKNEIYILDFDDCGLALPIWDIAVTLYYHANQKNFGEYLESYLKGYTSVRALPFENRNTLKMYMIGRGLTLINDVVTWENSKISEELPEIFDKVEARLKNILKMNL